jgi:hypothetical protein
MLMNGDNAGEVFLAVGTLVVLDGHALVLLLHVGAEIGRLRKSENSRINFS